MSEQDVVVDVDSMSTEEVSRELASLKGAKDEGTPEVIITQPEASEPEVKVETVDVKTEDNGFLFNEEEYLSQGWTKGQVDVLRKKEEQIWNKERFIQRQESEVSSARKRELELQQKEQEINQKLSDIASRKESLKDQFYDNPDAYNEAIASEFDIRRQQQEVASQRQSLATQKLVYERVPEFQSLMDTEIPNVLREDAQRAGYTELQTQELLNGFKNGWASADPRDVLVVAEKARLRSEISHLKSQVSTISQTPDQVGKKIAQIANQRPIVNSSGNTESSIRDIESMSDEEVAIELKELKIKSRR